MRIDQDPSFSFPEQALTRSEGKPAGESSIRKKDSIAASVVVGHYDTSSIIVEDGLRDWDLVVNGRAFKLCGLDKEVRLLESDAAVQNEPQLQYFGMGSGAPLVRMGFWSIIVVRRADCPI